MKRITILLLISCIAAYAAAAVYMIFFSGKAESAGAVLVILAMMLPALPVTAAAETVCLVSKNTAFIKAAEKTAFLADCAGTVIMGGFWLLMVLHGGDHIMTYAAAVTGINITVTLLFGIKIRYGDKNAD